MKRLEKEEKFLSRNGPAQELLMSRDRGTTGERFWPYFWYNFGVFGVYLCYNFGIFVVYFGGLLVLYIWEGPPPAFACALWCALTPLTLPHQTHTADWVQCCNPMCGKWRPLMRAMDGQVRACLYNMPSAISPPCRDRCNACTYMYTYAMHTQKKDVTTHQYNTSHTHTHGHRRSTTSTTSATPAPSCGSAG